MSGILPKSLMMNTGDVRYVLSYSDGNTNVSADHVDDSHIHSCIEVYLNISGEVSFLVKNNIYPIKQGDVIITRASELHHCVYHSIGAHEHFCLWIEQDSSSQFMSFVNKSDINHLSFSPDDREKLISLFFNAYRATKKGDTFEASVHILNIFLMIRRGFDHPFTRNTPTLPDDFQRILDYVNVNYGGITKACRIADEFFISLSTLNRRFLKYLHMSPKEYLESVRLSNAKRMLDEGNSVTSVCFACGYSDSSHFIRSFKRKFHITPHKYKARTKSTI